MKILDAKIMLESIKYRPGYKIRVKVETYIVRFNVSNGEHHSEYQFSRDELEITPRASVLRQVYSVIRGLEMLILDHYLKVGGNPLLKFYQKT